MKIEIDRKLCNGYGNCIAAAPDIFDLDDLNIAVLLRDTDESDRAEAVEAVADCPVRALKIVEE
jgi:ferredoxin